MSCCIPSRRRRGEYSSVDLVRHPCHPNGVAMITGDCLRTALMLMALSLTARVSYPQPRVVDIPATPSCTGCTISLRKVVTLGDSSDPILLDWATNITRDPRGRYFSAPHPGHQVVVYDSLGRYSTAVGRRGQGPGEFTSANRVSTGPDGLLYVFEANRQVTVLGPGLTFRRRTALPRITAEVQPRGGGRLILAYSSPPLDTSRRRPTIGPSGAVTVGPPRRSRPEDPVLVVDSEMRTLRTFGRTPSDTGLTCQLCTSRVIGGSPDPATVWLGRTNQYQIEKWDTAGRHLLTLRRGVDWYPTWGVDPTQPIAERGPVLGAIEEDAERRLWVFFIVPDPAMSQTASIGGRVGISALVAQTQGLLDTVVEVIDPSSGRLLASRRFADPVHSLGGRYGYTMRESPSGYVFADVWELVLSPP